MKIYKILFLSALLFCVLSCTMMRRLERREASAGISLIREKQAETPKEAYTKADLNWMDKKSRSSVEMTDKKIRPEITDTDAKISEYDEIFLGFPIWWYVAPTIINTFLEKYDFTGKKIVLFATSGGSGFGNTVKELQPSAPGAQFVEGRLLNHANKKEIEELVTEF